MEVFLEAGDTKDRQAHFESCIVQDCRLCASSIAHICSCWVDALCKIVKCGKNWAAPVISPRNPCPHFTRFPSKTPDEPAKGLRVSSGSLCCLLLHYELIFLQPFIRLCTDSEQRLRIEALTEKDLESISSELSREHALEASDGIDNRYITIVHLICHKYFIFTDRESRA